MQRGKYLKFLDFPPVGLWTRPHLWCPYHRCVCVRERCWPAAGCEPESPKISFKIMVFMARKISLFFMAADWRSGDFFSCWFFSLSKMEARSTKIFNDANNNTHLLYSLAFQPEVYLPPDQQHSPGWGVCEPRHCQPLVLTSKSAKSAVYTCIKPSKKVTSLPWHIRL